MPGLVVDTPQKNVAYKRVNIHLSIGSTVAFGQPGPVRRMNFDEAWERLTRPTDKKLSEQRSHSNKRQVKYVR